MNLNQFKGFIFDLDGTLVDSKLDFNLMRKEIGISDDTPVLEFLEKQSDSELIKKGHEIIDQHEWEGALKATWIEGAQEYINYLKSLNLPLGILTRNSRIATAKTCERLNIDVDIILTRDDCLPKPSPEGLVKMSKAWGLDPDDLIYFGDFYFDLLTARNASMAFALFQSSQLGPQSFEDEAQVVFDCYFKLLSSMKQGLR